MLKKTSNARPLTGSVINGYSDSTSNTYSCDYINKMDVYSTGEVKTNKVWIDGKPIYRKLYSFTMLSASGTQTIPFGVQNIDTITYYTGIIYGYNSNVATRPLPLCDGTTSNNIRIDTNSSGINIKQYANWENYRGYITLEYTKSN